MSELLLTQLLVFSFAVPVCLWQLVTWGCMLHKVCQNGWGHSPRCFPLLYTVCVCVCVCGSRWLWAESCTRYVRIAAVAALGVFLCCTCVCVCVCRGVGEGTAVGDMGLNATQSMSEMLRSQPLVFFCAVHACVCGSRWHEAECYTKYVRIAEVTALGVFLCCTCVCVTVWQ